MNMNMQRLRLFHLDYFNIMLDVVRGLLKDAERIQFIGQSHDPGVAEKLLERNEFDILVWGFNNAAELRHEFSHQLTFLSRIRSQFPDVKIVVYSMNNYADDIAEIINRGANWYLGNSIGKEKLLDAIIGVKKGQQYVGQQFYSLFRNADEYFTGFSQRLIPNDKIFSYREMEILRYIATGRSSREISEALNITPKTVETHRKNLIKKARVKNTPELMFFSFQHGFL